jgi:hypothetical protein
MENLSVEELKQTMSVIEKAYECPMTFQSKYSDLPEYQKMFDEAKVEYPNLDNYFIHTCLIQHLHEVENKICNDILEDEIQETN